MCSILAILDVAAGSPELRTRALRLSKLQRHRGPDWSGIWAADGAVLAHERLAIVDVLHGAQPLLNPAGTHALAVNGEIYNHRALRAGLKEPYQFATESDCEVILALYREHGADFLDRLNGIFAFVLFDAARDRYLIARDHLGIVPLYIGRGADGTLHVASEMKALVPVCPGVREFPPGHVLDSAVDAEPRPWYIRAWREYEAMRGGPSDPAGVRAALEDAVHRQLMCDVPYGVLLSGGLDSSIIAAVARRHAEDGRPLHSFAVGLPGSPDLAAAREVAAHIDTEHHELHFTVQEGIDALFGGYLYFHRAPDARAFHEAAGAARWLDKRGALLGLRGTTARSDTPSTPRRALA